MAFVTKAYSDRRVGAKNQAVTIQNPTLQQVTDAIHRLDGKEHTELIFSGDKRELTISGGNDGRYIAFISVNVDEAFYNLINPQGSTDVELRIVAGGQVGTYPSRVVVPLSDVLSAATGFYESGEVPTLPWEKQD